MSKTKTPKGSGKSGEKVKEGRVQKSVDAPKSHSKKVAGETAAKISKSDKKSKKSKREPSPESESESDSAASESEVSSDDSGAEKTPAKSGPAQSAKAQVNDTSKGKHASASESESDSSASSESEPEAKVPKANGSAPKASKQAPKAAKSSDSSGSESESESESDGGVPAAKQANVGKSSDAPAVNGKASKGDSDEDSSEGDDGSEGSSDASDSGSEGSEGDDESQAEAGAGSAEVSVKKRKADAVDESAAKKTKVAADGPTTLFVGNLSWNIDDEWLGREFEGFGEIIRSNVMTQRDTGKSKGFGFVEFATAEAAKSAHDAKKDQDLDGRAMNVDYTTGKDQAGGARAGGAGGDRNQRMNQRAQNYGDSRSKPSNTLFCGNLAFSLTAEILKDTFSEYGTVTGVRMPTDRDSGQLKGYGYVEFTSTEEAQSAIDAMNGADLGGRSVRLDFSGPKPDGGGGGRGGFGGGRGGRGSFGGDRGGRGGRGGGRGFDSGGRGGRGGRGGSTNRGMFSLLHHSSQQALMSLIGGYGDFSGTKTTF